MPDYLIMQLDGLLIALAATKQRVKVDGVSSTKVYRGQRRAPGSSPWSNIIQDLCQ